MNILDLAKKPTADLIVEYKEIERTMKYYPMKIREPEIEKYNLIKIILRERGAMKK